MTQTTNRPTLRVVVECQMFHNVASIDRPAPHLALRHLHYAILQCIIIYILNRTSGIVIAIRRDNSFWRYETWRQIWQQSMTDDVKKVFDWTSALYGGKQTDWSQILRSPSLYENRPTGFHWTPLTGHFAPNVYTVLEGKYICVWSTKSFSTL